MELEKYLNKRVKLLSWEEIKELFPDNIDNDYDEDDEEDEYINLDIIDVYKSTHAEMLTAQPDAGYLVVETDEDDNTVSLEDEESRAENEQEGNTGDDRVGEWFHKDMVTLSSSKRR